MTDLYHEDSRVFQDLFDTRRMADRLQQVIVHEVITPNDREFIESADMFFMATVDNDGHANCSYKGGEPGFVRVVDEKTIAFPSYDGNGMYLTAGNVAQTGEVGLLFIDFEQKRRLRLNGQATISVDDPLLPEFPEAQLVVRVRARQIFTNCPRYIHRMKLVQRSRFVPRTGCDTPVPAWKKGDWLADALPENDPARDDSLEVLGQ